MAYDDRDPSFEEGVFSLNEKIASVSVVDIRLGDEILSPFRYDKLLSKLANLSPTTLGVNVDLANRGGDVGGLVVLLNAFQSCGVPVHFNIIGECYSCAAVLALVGNSISFQPGGFLMFHNYSWEPGGKGNELIDMVKHSERQYNALLKRICTPFLTAEEVHSIAHDRDVYVTAESKGLKKRIKRHFGEKSK